MAELAVIGGTGLNTLPGFVAASELKMDTPYGPSSAPPAVGTYQGLPVIFLARHGQGHHLPPHRINYRANIWALREAGVKRVLAVAAVGGIRKDMAPGQLAFPDQLIDYTWGRAHSFSDGESNSVQHVEFGKPYDEDFRRQCIALSGEAIPDGVYGVTQGPRLETEAEIRRMQRDGVDVVGMTGMPEAALAREAGLAYVCAAVVVNWAAGLGEGGIHDQIEQSVAEGMSRVGRLLDALAGG